MENNQIIAPQHQALACKVCAAESPHFFTTDFHKNAQIKYGWWCADVKPCGKVVDYYRCMACGFIFTPFMDDWTSEQFKQRIYNKDYPHLDGGYNGARGGSMANLLYLAIDDLPSKRILDYGGGAGICTHLLSGYGAGYAGYAQSYDPFVNFREPEGLFDIIVFQECAEHTTDPQKTFKDLLRFRKPGGIIIGTTELIPGDIEKQRGDWWYAAPRCGHISFYTKDTLENLYTGLNVVFVGNNAHIAYDVWPLWGAKLLPPGSVPA